MDLLSRMLVAVDGSAPSDAAVALAVRLAAPKHDLVSFVSVFDRDALIGRCTTDAIAGVPMHEVLAASEAESERVLDAAKGAASLAGVDASALLLVGIPEEAIVAEARDVDASCVVIGTHGRGGIVRGLLGSCAEAVVRKSPVPVLVTHAPPPAGDPFARLLCAVDDSPAARHAFDAAVALAAERDAELHLLAVVQIADQYASGYELEGFDPDGSMSSIYAEARAPLKALAAEAAASGARVMPHVLGGSDVAERIVQCAAMNGCSAIMLGTHGRRGIERAILGSTADGVLRASAVPVIVFRDPQEREPSVHERKATVAAS